MSKMANTNGDVRDLLDTEIMSVTGGGDTYTCKIINVTMADGNVGQVTVCVVNK